VGLLTVTDGESWSITCTTGRGDDNDDDDDDDAMIYIIIIIVEDGIRPFERRRDVGNNSEDAERTGRGALDQRKKRRSPAWQALHGRER